MQQEVKRVATSVASLACKSAAGRMPACLCACVPAAAAPLPVMLERCLPAARSLARSLLSWVDLCCAVQCSAVQCCCGVLAGRE